VRSRTADGRSWRPEKWWDRYLNSKQDRLDWELEAHCVEYEKYIKDNPARAFRRRYLASCAERLSGPLYGRMLKKDEAKRLSKEEAMSETRAMQMWKCASLPKF